MAPAGWPVDTVTGEDGGDVAPDAATATTSNVYEVFGVRPVTVNVVPAGLPTSVLVDPNTWNTRYPLTALADAGHESDTDVAVAPDAVGVPGAAGPVDAPDLARCSTVIE